MNRRDLFEVDEDRALDALRMVWGDAYDIGFGQDMWVARHQGASGDLLTGITPDELNAAIRADWATRSAG